MKARLKIVYWGMMISFLGALPPGVMNIMSLQIAGNRGAGDAIIYAMGSMLAEIIIVRITLSGLNWLTRNRIFFNLLEWITAILLLSIATACFFAAGKDGTAPVIIPALSSAPFIAGIFFSVINPLHIPFWMGWSTVLMNKGILAPGSAPYNWYVAGIGMGTMAGFAVYIFGGQYLVNAYMSHQMLINCITGIVLLVTAAIQVKKMIAVPVAVRHARLMQRS